MRRKKERSKQGETNKAKQHSTPKAHVIVGNFCISYILSMQHSYYIIERESEHKKKRTLHDGEKMSKFMFLTNMPVLTFTGLKNGSVVPDSKDSVTIEFLVKLCTIYTVSYSLSTYRSMWASIHSGTWALPLQGYRRDQFILLQPDSIFHCK